MLGGVGVVATAEDAVRRSRRPREPPSRAVYAETKLTPPSSELRSGSIPTELRQLVETRSGRVCGDRLHPAAAAGARSARHEGSLGRELVPPRERTGCSRRRRAPCVRPPSAAERATALPAFAAAHGVAGKAALALNQDLDGADAHYAAAIEVDPEAAGPYFNRGLIALRQQTAGRGAQLLLPVARASARRMPSPSTCEVRRRSRSGKTRSARSTDLERATRLNDRWPPPCSPWARPTRWLGPQRGGEARVVPKQRAGKRRAAAKCSAP